MQGLAEIKTYGQKMQDALVTKSLQYQINCTIKKNAFWYMCAIASRDSQGLAEIKTYAQKMQDAQVTKSLQYQINCTIKKMHSGKC